MPGTRSRPAPKFGPCAIAKLHRDVATRRVLTHLCCAERAAEAREECIEVVGRSTDPDLIGALITAASFADAQGDRAARLLGSRGEPEHLESALKLLKKAPERTAIRNATARLYWKATRLRVDNLSERAANLRQATADVLRAEPARSVFIAALARNKASVHEHDPASLLSLVLSQSPKETSFESRFRLVQAAAQLDRESRSVSQWVHAQLQDELWMVRREAFAAAVEREPTRATALVAQALADPSPRVRQWGLQAFQELPPQSSNTESLHEVLKTEAWPFVRAEVAHAFASVSAFEDAARLLADPARRVRAQAMRALDGAPDPLRLEAVKHVLRRDPEWPQVQIAALDVAKRRCLDVKTEVAAFVRREDARVKRLHSEDALFRAIAVYAALASRPEFNALLDSPPLGRGSGGGPPL